MSYHDALQSHAQRDSDNHIISCNDTSEAAGIVNSYDGAI